MNLHLENKDSLVKLQAEFPGTDIQEIERSNIGLSKKLIEISNSLKKTVERVRTRLKEFGSLNYVPKFNVPNSSKKFLAVA
jgi:hypothetical protein